MNMEYEHPARRGTSNSGDPRPISRKSSGHGGRYLKEPSKKTHSTSIPRRRRRRRRKLNPRFVIMLSALLAVLIGVLLVVRSCNKPNIVGRWDMDGTTFYLFHEDGTGVLELPIKDYEFTYEIDDGVLHIDFKDESAEDLNYTFELQKDTLFLTGGPGDAKIDYALNRVG